MKRYALLALVAALALAGAYGLGRYTAPSKTKTAETTETKTDESTHTVAVIPPTTTTTAARKAPGRPAAPAPKDGVCPACPTIDETTTTTTQSAPTIIKTDTERHEESEVKRVTVVEHDYPRLTLGLGAAVNLGDVLAPPKLTGMAAYRFAGPLSAWGTVQRVGSRDVQVVLGLALTF